MSSKVPIQSLSRQWHKITAMLWHLCPARNTCQAHLVSRCLMLHTPFVGGESCAVPWLHRGSDGSKAHLTWTVFCPHCCCQLGTGCWQSVYPTTGTGGRASAVCLCANIGHGAGCQEAECHPHCLVTTRHCKWPITVFDTNISESIILSSTGIIISTDNISRNSSSLLQPTPFCSIPCANRGGRVKCSLLLWPGCHVHLPRALHCSISKPFVSL